MHFDIFCTRVRFEPQKLGVSDKYGLLTDLEDLKFVADYQIFDNSKECAQQLLWHWQGMHDEFFANNNYR